MQEDLEFKASMEKYPVSPNKIKTKGLVGIAKWKSTCLAYTCPDFNLQCYQKRKKKKRNF
jgi:hypothetical protein